MSIVLWLVDIAQGWCLTIGEVIQATTNEDESVFMRLGSTCKVPGALSVVDDH